MDLKIQKAETQFSQFSFQKPTSAVWRWFVEWQQYFMLVIFM